MKNNTHTAQRICHICLRFLAALALTAALGGFVPLDRQQAPALIPMAAAASQEQPVLNILLIGQDSPGGETARSDSIILCSVRREEKKLTLTSFLRDLYVKIPGHGSNRLNAAYAYGGTALLKKTIEQNFHIDIHGCVEVDFACFPELIDVLGGVEIALREDEAKWLNRQHPGSQLAEGVCKLTGPQALSYARIRKLDADGDFSRTRRQRKLLIALVDGYRDAGLVKGIAIVQKLIPYVSTDMEKETILRYARDLLPGLSGIKLASQTVPAPGTYTCRRIQGMDVLTADLEAAARQLAAAAGSGGK